MREGVGVGEGVEDITLSFCVPCECLSFRLRNLLIVLMLDQVLQDKAPAAVHLTEGRSGLGCIYLGALLDNSHESALGRGRKGNGRAGMNPRLNSIAIKNISK